MTMAGNMIFRSSANVIAAPRHKVNFMAGKVCVTRLLPLVAS